jgi:hypothetical protein
MEERAVFGIVVPVRTGLPYLPSALESLRLQGGLAQVALMDASGDPAVADLAAAYGGLIRHRRHADRDAGQAAAIAEGWEHLSASIYGWLNADDVLFPGALQRVKQEFDDHPEVDVVYGDCVFTDADGAFLGYFPSIADTVDGLGASCVICQPGCFVRGRALALAGGVDRGLVYTMDWDLWLRLRDAGCRFRRIEAPLAAVRILPEAKTFSGGLARRREIDRILVARGGPMQRLRSHLGHLRHETMATGAPWARFIWRYLRRPRNRQVLHGLGRSDNRLHGEARIALPLLSAGDRVVTIELDRPAKSLAARLGDASLSLRPAEDRRRWSAEVAGLSPGVLDFRLAGEPDRLRVRRLQLTPSPFGTEGA